MNLTNMFDNVNRGKKDRIRFCGSGVMTDIKRKESHH
jgi:hypothetical protein